MTHGSLFSGIGGFDLAAQWSGIDNIFHCEIDQFNRELLKKRFKNSESHADIQEFKAEKYRDKIDIISGGFPCQDISISNTKAKGIEGERSGLWKHYARVVGEIRPKYIIFENSPALLIRGFEQVLCDLHQLGYDAEWKCFFASDFGYPHFRKRLYGVAYSKSKRCTNIIKKGGILQKIYAKKTPRQINLPMSFKRYDSQANYDHVRMDNGFSKELDKRIIKAYGNAIIPAIAHSIFEELKQI